MRTELLHILALVTLEYPVAEAASAWALAVLLADKDTESIRVLAGLSPTAFREEIAPWLGRAAQDLGVRLPTPEESRWILSMTGVRQARDLALAMIEGQIGLIEGCWKARDLAFAAAEANAELRALFLPFVAVTSETDHLPIGEERANWDPDVTSREGPRDRRLQRSASRGDGPPLPRIRRTR